MNHKLALVLFLFAFIVMGVVGFGGKDDLRPAPAEFRAKFNETLLGPRKSSDPAMQRSPASAPAATPPRDRRPAGAKIVPMKDSDPLDRDAFIRKYGDRLEVTSYEGRVVRIDGSGIPSDAFDPSQKIPGFRPSSEGDVAGRGREVFANARQLLGISPAAEFILNAPTTGESSAQIVVQQSENGLPIYPGGLVTILLGSDGEVRAVESSIYSKTEIANAATGAPIPDQSREILYVTQSAPTAVLRHAYETRNRGIQRVIDAQTGAVLLEKNRQIK
jgi:hypothetical protein